MIIQKLENKRILIWGYGREGKSAENFINTRCKAAAVDVFEGAFEDIKLDSYDYVLKSPGIPYFGNDERIISMTQLFLEQFGKQTVGITGTKGKSTTAAMLYHVLNKCGKKAVLVGNIGLPCLDYYDEIDEDTIVVFELSCHQLNNITVSPHVAVILNLYEEHLDYYQDAEKYYYAKKNITRFQSKEDFLVMGSSVETVDTVASVTVLWQDKKYDHRLRIPGSHNCYNAEVVCNIAEYIFDRDKAAVEGALESFEGLPHRLECAGEKEGIVYYDDSISTIPEAAICAATSIENAQTLLIGGMDRGINYDILIDFIKEHSEYKYICMYESGKRIYQEVASLEYTYYENDLDDAVKKAAQITDKGKAVIMSPAAASYGYFKNFEERGDYFKALVK